MLDTILQRGLEGNIELVKVFTHCVTPLLCAMALLIALHIAFGRPRALMAAGRRWPLVYLLIAAVMLGTSLAAPKNNYRLYIAPALFLVIVAVSAIDRMWETAVVRWLSTTGALIVHLALIALCWQTYSAVHPVELDRLARARAAAPGSHLKVPRLPFHKGNRIFKGDGIYGDAKSRKRMAKIYGVKSVTVVRASEL